MTWPFGEYPPGGVERLGPHVLAVYGESMPLSNSAVVIGADATLAFDANVLGWAGVQRSLVDDRTAPLMHLVLSHYHDDHTLGAALFSPPAEVRARARTRTRLARWEAEGVDAERYTEWGPDAPAALRDLRIVVPAVDVDEPETLDLGGGVRVHLFPHPVAHTTGDLWAFVEPDEVALCGDLWFHACEPYIEASAAGSRDAVAALRACGARVHLPGHGHAGVVGPVGEDPLERYCAWLVEQAHALPDLEGRGLAAEIRRRYDSLDPMFPFAIPGFLEASVGAAERDRDGGRA
jgi:glyoxylase-like metal-dependent hydrolase (beta-lactamase superfamily II)